MDLAVRRPPDHDPAGFEEEFTGRLSVREMLDSRQEPARRRLRHQPRQDLVFAGRVLVFLPAEFFSGVLDLFRTDLRFFVGEGDQQG